MINSLLNFFYMGGYGDYVWSAYGIVAIVLIGILFSTIKWERRLLHREEKEKTINHASSP